MFIGCKSNLWEVYPIKKIRNGIVAFQDYTKDIGAADIIKTDNEKSETLGLWKEHCRKHCIGMETSEPNHHHQNPVENYIGNLGSMVKKLMHEFQVPTGKFD